jgi:manganese transport protein
LTPTSSSSIRPPSHLSGVLLYSVISAAFIGPGTITTAISAGASHGISLLWAVTLGTLGCLVLQEVSARIVIISGMNIGQAVRTCYGERYGYGLMMLTGGTVIAGCAAYEAGNILGAVSGLNLITHIDTRVLTVISVVLAGIILWTNKRNVISWLMTGLVGLMGITFLILAVKQPISLSQILQHATVPESPSGSSLLILGLVGTTIVPYNIFLGSGISKGKTIPLMRIGLTVSVLIGGLITGAILLAGTSVQAFSSFPELASLLREQLGAIGSAALGIGLFAAGFSSSITAPYASAVIASTAFGWDDMRKIRMVWGTVLLIGFSFGISGVKPVPVILVVQALNGLILPLLTGFLIMLINNRRIIPREHQQSILQNIVLLFIFGSITLLGLNQVDSALYSFGLFSERHLSLLLILTGLIVGAITISLFRKRTI